MEIDLNADLGEGCNTDEALLDLVSSANIACGWHAGGATAMRDCVRWAVRKGDPDMLNWLNNFLAQSKRDGTYDALYRKWFEGTAWLQNLK